MIHRIKKVQVQDEFVILAVFQNGIEKAYDIRNLYSVFPQFKLLEQNQELFASVKVDAGGYGISWNDELDLEAEEIWEEGKETGKIHEMDIVCMIGQELSEARVRKGITQKELSERIGIYQAEISKIERGLANPSVSTLKRIAEGIGMRVEIRFVPDEDSIL